MSPPLRRTSPCEHGETHHITQLQEGCDFYVSCCVDGRRKMIRHRVTAELYPVIIDRRTVR